MRNGEQVVTLQSGNKMRVTEDITGKWSNKENQRSKDDTNYKRKQRA